MHQKARAGKLAADLLHEQINFPTVLPDVVIVDKPAARARGQDPGDRAPARFLPFRLDYSRRCGLLRQINRPKTQWQTKAASPQVIIATEVLSMDLANVELTSRSPRQGKAVQQAFRQDHAMEGVPHVNGGIPEAAAPMALQTRQRLGADQRHPGGRLKWRLTSLASTINRCQPCFLWTKKASAEELRRPTKTGQPFLKKFANEPHAGHSSLPGPGPGGAEPFLAASRLSSFFRIELEFGPPADPITSVPR